MGETRAHRILVIVPAYNEEGAIAQVVADLRACAVELDVLVVDDGSLDRTAERAQEAGVAVCSLPHNMGIGVTVQTGFLYAVRHGYDVACQFDGDGQHVAAELPALLCPVLAGAADVCIGSRFLGVASHRPSPVRRVGTAWLRMVIRVLSGTQVTDVTSGFRAYSASALNFLAEHYPTQFPEPEAIVWLVRHGFRVTEVPVTMRERQAGRSSIGFIKSVWYAVRVTLGIVITCTRARVNWKGS